MSSMQVRALKITCPHCEAEVPFDETRAFANEGEMVAHLQERITEHLNSFPSCRKAAAQIEIQNLQAAFRSKGAQLAQELSGGAAETHEASEAAK